MNLAVLSSPEYLELKNQNAILIKENQELKANYNLLHDKYTALVEESNRQFAKLMEENKQILAVLQEVKELLALKINENNTLKKALYGSSSEKIELQELKENLVTETKNQEQVPIDSTQTKKKKEYAQRKQRTGLKNETEFIPVTDTLCPDCNEELEIIGNEDSQKLGFHLQQITKITLSRQKKHCKCCNKFIIADIPPKYSVITQGMPSSELLTQIAISKYIDHLPWYRQENIMIRSFCELPRQSMCDWMLKLAVIIKPLYEQIKASLFTEKYLQGDETIINLKTKNRKELKVIQRYMWSILSPKLKMVYFHFGDRTAKTAKELYEGYEGFLQTDYYSGYNDLVNIVRLSCLAHCRRKFIESDDCIAKLEVLNIFQEIYKIEADIRNLDSKARQKVRNTETRAKFEELKVLLQRIVAESIVNKSKLIQACHYSLNQWDDILKILEDEKFFIDNNNIENRNRPLAIGRKNWLFVCSQLGGESLAILCTVLHSAQLCGLDIFKYFNDVITRIADHPVSKIEELLPCNWKDPVLATNST